MSTHNEYLGMNIIRVFELQNIEATIAAKELSNCKYLDYLKSKKHKKSFLVDN